MKSGVRVYSDNLHATYFGGPLSPLTPGKASPAAATAFATGRRRAASRTLRSVWERDQSPLYSRYGSRGQRGRGDAGGAETAQERAALRYEAFWTRQLAEYDRAQVSRAVTAARRQRLREERYKDLESTVAAGRLVEESVDETLRVHDLAEAAKRRRLHEEWSKQVHEPLRSSGVFMLTSEGDRAISDRRHRHFQAYLDACNRSRGAAFLNSAVDGYDPGTAVRETKPIRVRRLRDPTRISIEKEEMERRLMGGVDPRPAPTARAVLDPVLWATGRIESTPHGRSVPSKPGAKGQPSQIRMDDFRHPRGRQAVDAEFAPGRRLLPQIKASMDAQGGGRAAE